MLLTERPRRQRLAEIGYNVSLFIRLKCNENNFKKKHTHSIISLRSMHACVCCSLVRWYQTILLLLIVARIQKGLLPHISSELHIFLIKNKQLLFKLKCLAVKCTADKNNRVHKQLLYEVILTLILYFSSILC